jgi:hypothetical protein
MAGTQRIDIATNPLKRGRGRPAKNADPFRPADPDPASANPAGSAPTGQPSDSYPGQPANSAGQASQAQRVALDPPDRVEVPPAAEPDAPRKRKRKTLFDVQEITDLGCHLAQFNQTLKPPVLRPIWEVSRAEVQDVAEPLAEILERLPDRYLEVATKMLDLSAPLALIGATYKLIAPRRAQEKALIAELEAEYARQSVGNQGGHIRAEGSPNSAAAGPSSGINNQPHESASGGTESRTPEDSVTAHSTGIPFASAATDILSGGFGR